MSSEISIEGLHCGSLSAGLEMFEAGGGSDAVTVPVPAWLIRHPQGEVLFDTGMHTDLTLPGPLLDTVSLFYGVDLDAGSTIAGRLIERQIEPDSIELVVLSHLHFDHAGGLAQLPNARVLIQAAEWDAGTDEELSAANSFRREDYDLGHDVVVVDGEHDVFGDGSLTCLPTPGHTPGHQSLRVRTGAAEIVLCADCAYFERTLGGGPLPPFGHDLDEQRQSLERLAAMARRGARLVPGHDPQVFEALDGPFSS